jgi:hypothetical protein
VAEIVGLALVELEARANELTLDVEASGAMSRS